MQDDYNDRYSNHAALGKYRASDEANQKLTFARLFDQQKLLQSIEHYYERALNAIKPLGTSGDLLRELTHSLHQQIPISHLILHMLILLKNLYSENN